MSEKKTKKENYTFFNEEWNEPFWEDGADVVDQRNHTKRDVVED
jgi:hypothetical protein